MIYNSSPLSFSLAITGTTGLLLLAVVVLLMALLVRQRREQFSHRPTRNYPPSPSALPIIGHLHHLSQYAENPWEGFDSFRKAHGDIVGLQLGTHKAVMISSSELMREVLLTKGDIFCNRPTFDRYRQIFGGDRDNSLALCDWTDLQKIRRQVATIGILPRYGSNLYKHLNSCIELDVAAFSDVLKHDLILKKSDLLFACANIFTNYLCSKRFEATNLEYLEVLYIYDYVFYDINQCYAIDFIPTLAKLGIGRSYVNNLVGKCNKLRTYMENTLLKPRAEKYLNANNSDTKLSLEDNPDLLLCDKDFLDLSLQHHFDNPKSYPWSVNVYEVLDLIGGHSAVGNLLMRLLGYLALDRDAQDCICNEAKVAMESTGSTQPNLDHKHLMPYTEAAILETLRLASSPIVPHVAAEATTLQDYDIDEGTMVMFNSYHLNLGEKYWKEPRKFNPERFLATSEVTGKRFISKPEHFFPFSSGRRACLGYKMVTAITFSMVANICARFVMSPLDSAKVAEQIKPRGNLALCPDSTFQLQLTERN